MNGWKDIYCCFGGKLFSSGNTKRLYKRILSLQPASLCPAEPVPESLCLLLSHP